MEVTGNNSICKLSNQSGSERRCETNLSHALCGLTEPPKLFPELNTIFTVVVILISLLLNSVIVVTICFSKRLHTTPNVFIASLAAVDLIFSLVIGLRICTDVIFDRSSEATVVLELMLAFFASYTLVSNDFHHLLISLERWLYIARPFLHQRIVTWRSTACGLTAVWITSLFVNIKLLIKDFSTASYSRTHFGLIMPCFHASVSVVLFINYTHIGVITCRQARAILKATRAISNVSASPQADKRLASLKRTWRYVRMFVLVFGTFFVFLSPLVIIDLYAYTAKENVMDISVYPYFKLLAISHPCMNFFIYAVQNKAFKLVLQKFFLRISSSACHRRVHPVTSANNRRSGSSKVQNTN